MAEGARLESVYTFTGIMGSNPILSASSYWHSKSSETRASGEFAVLETLLADLGWLQFR